MDLLTVMTELANFGVAGLMGAMWLWERRSSREREQQLTDAHERIARDEQRLDKLTQVVELNTAAFSRFDEVQRQVVQALREVKEVQRA